MDQRHGERLDALALTVFTLTHGRATFDESKCEWIIAPGAYEVQLGAGSDDIRATAKLRLAGRRLMSPQFLR